MSPVGGCSRSAPGSATPASPIERRRARIDGFGQAATISLDDQCRREDGLKPPPFAYAKARSVAHAIELLAADDARLLAGGQSLIATLNMRVSQPALLVDINGVGGLDHITLRNPRIQIGAPVPYAQTEPSPRTPPPPPPAPLPPPHTRP